MTMVLCMPKLRDPILIKQFVSGHFTLIYIQGFKRLPDNKHSSPNTSFSQKWNDWPDLLKAEGDKEVESITEMNQGRIVGPEHFLHSSAVVGWLGTSSLI